MKIIYRLLSVLLLSIMIYVISFFFVFMKPLTVGYCLDAYKKKQAYLSTFTGSKIVIVAGSNGLFSHSAKAIEEETGINCVNYSVSADMGIDFILEKTKEVIREGDIVIMPLEYEFYGQGKKAVIFSVMGNNYISQYERSYLFKFGIEKTLASLFSFDLKYMISSVIEMGLTSKGFQRRFNIDTLNQNGDMIGHTKEKSAAYESFIRQIPEIKPPYKLLSETPYSCIVIQDFLKWCKNRNVKVYGSLPTTFDDEAHDERIITRIKDIYLGAGQDFIELPNHSQYPRSCFYDTGYHLNFETQQLHSRVIAGLIPHRQTDSAAN